MSVYKKGDSCMIKRLCCFMLASLMLIISINAAPTECLGSHPNGYSLVNPYCAGRYYNRAGSCVLGHYYPCEVTITEAYTGYHCSVHGNEVEPAGDIHYERIVHIDGNDITVVDEPCCPYKPD